jgi:membrane protein
LFGAMFAVMFKLLPDVKIRWRNVVGGALVTAALFVIGKVVIGLYIGHSTVASSYGAAGSLIAMLVWVYYSAVIVFLGAEITQAWAERRGEAIEPSARARRLPHYPEETTKGAAPKGKKPPLVQRTT